MPIKANRFYNNPDIGAAFSNLAELFAPPSAQDTAAYARAKAETEAASRLGWLFTNPDDPTASRRAALTGIQDYAQTPAGFATSTETTRRGQDVDSADRRYGVDAGARTSIANNAADNARAITTNTADNVRAVDVAKLGGIAGFFGPLSEGQVRPAVPGDIASQFGASGALPQAEGRAKPLSETEWRAAQAERLRNEGALTNDQTVDLIVGDRTPVETVGPDGRSRFMSPGEAVRTGAQPAPKSPLVAVNNGPGGDGKLREKLDESEGKRLSDLQAAAVTSAGLRQDLDLMRELIEEAPQGPLVGRLAAAFPGFSDAGTAFQSIVERAAPGLRVEGSGATSDIEFRGMLNSLPRLQNRPQANRLIAEMMRAKADINVRRGELVTAYQNGDLDASQMRQRLADLNRQSILSPGLKSMIDAVGGGAEPLTRNAPTATPSPGSIVDGFRFKGGDPSSPDSWEAL